MTIKKDRQQLPLGKEMFNIILIIMMWIRGRIKVKDLEEVLIPLRVLFGSYGCC